MVSKQPETKRHAVPAARAAAAPPARRTAATRRPAVRTRPGVTKPAEDNRVAGVTPEQRYLMIAEAAYLRAQRRDFAPGGEVQDWLEAEAEVDARMRER